MATPKVRRTSTAAKPKAKAAGGAGRLARKRSLAEYQRKRDFTVTPEPCPEVKSSKKGLFFCVQKHAASHLHYDLRLELDGVLLSWAVPKGPSLDPSVKRLAMHVEDHPLDYGNFEGTIPKGEYGGGTVMLWDRGKWHPWEDARQGYREGRLKFELHGEKLKGGWMLVHRGGRKAGPEERTWFLIKERDEYARPIDQYDVTEELPLSVKTGRDLDEIAAGAKPKKTAKPRATKTAAKSAAARKKKVNDDHRRDVQGSRNGTVHADSAGSRYGASDASDFNAVWHSNRPSRRSTTSIDLSKAPRAPMPSKIEPQLATLVKAAPEGDHWLHEIKLDGYRMVARIVGGKATFTSRNDQDWTGRFGLLVEAAQRLPVKQAILDGEVVVLEPDGTTSFQSLQNILSEHRTKDLIYFVFDLLYLDGHDLRRLPLEERKAILAKLVRHSDRGPIRFVEHIEGHGPEFFEQACKAKLEGIISKRRDAPYRSGRVESWVKTKCGQRDEFVIVGFTDPERSRQGFGALLLGYHDDDGALVYAGRVGTGFSHQTLVDLRKRLDGIERATTPLEKRPTVPLGKGVHWVDPDLVAQVEFSNWTRDGILRHPSFQGLREDKEADEVVRDKPKDPPTRRNGAPQAKASTRKAAAAPSRSVSSAPKSDGSIEVLGQRLTSPDKVLYPDQGITKQELAEYYAAVAEWMLPHVAHRPLSLVRCPQGRMKECFYQKHVQTGLADVLGRVKIREKSKIGQYVIVENAAGLVALVQMGVLEIHIWGALAKDFERPDRLVFDLDPDEGLPWQRVIEGARLLRGVLEALGLRSFLKTTGGKGLHVVVPIRPKDEWDEVKDFCRAIVERIVAEAPGQYVASMSKAARKGKIFIDFFRNDRGATFIAAYSTRAREGAPVSVPLAWEELKGDVRSDSYNIRNVPRRLAMLKRDPWAEMLEVKQSITAGMKKAVAAE